MLPSFRLIAATFLCGFLVVFAGLRVATSLNDMHEGLPVMAAHAAPVTIVPVADQDMRRALTAVPVMYDLRFVSSALPRPTPASMSDLVTDRAAPLGMPLVILPPENSAAKEAAAPAEPERAVAAIAPDAPVIPAPAAALPAIDVPAEQARIETPKIETPQVEMPRTETPVVAAIAPQPAAPEPVAAAPVIAAPEVTAAPAAEPAPTVKSAAIDPQAMPEMEAEQLVPESDTTASVDAPAAATDSAPAATTTAVPKPKPHAAKPAPKAKAKVLAKAKVVRKKHIRTAARRAPANTAGPFGSSTSNPFGTP